VSGDCFGPYFRHLIPSLINVAAVRDPGHLIPDT
jgi:hypothetical protein